MKTEPAADQHEPAAARDPRPGALAALRLVEAGPRAVRCTRCGAGEGRPCEGVESGRHHRERAWECRNQVLATLRTALDLDPYTGTTTPPSRSTR